MFIKRTRIFLIILAGWVMFGLFLTGQMYLFHPTSIVHYSIAHELTWELTLSLIWAVSTPLILWISRRFPIEKRTWLSRVPLHLVFSFGAGLLQCTVHGIVLMAVRIPPDQWSVNELLPSLFYNIDKMMMAYWVIVFVDHLLTYSRRLTEKELHESHLEARLAQAHLQALRMQLHPHFLFNTLNAVTTLLHQDPDSAERMIVRLGDLLRATLADAGKQTVSLREEVQYLASYLEIERIRFQDRLSVVYDLPEDTLDVSVPHMLLQPLAENAIKHGFARSTLPGRIEVAARRENGNLCLTVKDNGLGIRSDKGLSIREGVGIANTKARLQQMYASSAGFSLTNGANGGATATILLPLNGVNK